MWRFVRHIAFDMFAWGADKSGLRLVHSLACVAGVSLPLPFRTPATQAIHGLTWDQALFFLFFFCFFVSLAREGKNNALLPKADYRDKGRRHDRRLSTALFLFLCLKHKHKRKHKKNELVRFSCPYTYAHVDPVFTCSHMCLCLCLRLCLCLVKTRL